MAVGESRGMPNALIGSVISGIVGVAFIVIGVIQFQSCGGGYSVFWFGVGIIFIGGSVAMFGGIPFLFAFVVLALLLIAVGLSIAHGAGCSYSPSI